MKNKEIVRFANWWIGKSFLKPYINENDFLEYVKEIKYKRLPFKMVLLDKECIVHFEEIENIIYCNDKEFECVGIIDKEI